MRSVSLKSKHKLDHRLELRLTSDQFIFLKKYAKYVNTDISTIIRSFIDSQILATQEVNFLHED